MSDDKLFAHANGIHSIKCSMITCRPTTALRSALLTGMVIPYSHFAAPGDLSLPSHPCCQRAQDRRARIPRRRQTHTQPKLGSKPNWSVRVALPSHRRCSGQRERTKRTLSVMTCRGGRVSTPM